MKPIHFNEQHFNIDKYFIVITISNNYNQELYDNND